MNEFLVNKERRERREDHRLLLTAVLALVAVLLDVFVWRA